MAWLGCGAAFCIMKYMEKRPIVMLVIGVLGISLSAIFVKLSNAPSSVTAAYRLLWTVLLMSPSMLINREMRQELLGVNRRILALSSLSGVLLAFFSTILGHSVFSWCLKFFSPAFVSASKLCEPVIASIVAIFLFGEVPGILQILGSVIILAGVVFYTKVELAE